MSQPSADLLVVSSVESAYGPIKAIRGVSLKVAKSTIMTVAPISVTISRIQYTNSSVSSGFKPEEGSSKSRSSGCMHKARPNSTTLRTP